MDGKERSIMAREAITSEGVDKGKLADAVWLWRRKNRGYRGGRASVLNSINGLIAGKFCHTEMLDAIEACLITVPMRRPKQRQVVGEIKTLIPSGERQGFATALRIMACLVNGEPITRRHQIHFATAMKKAFGSFAPLKEGEANYEDLQKWFDENVAVSRAGSARRRHA